MKCTCYNFPELKLTSSNVQFCLINPNIQVIIINDCKKEENHHIEVNILRLIMKLLLKLLTDSSFQLKSETAVYI